MSTRARNKEEVSKDKDQTKEVVEVTQMDKLEKLICKCLKVELDPIKKQLSDMQSTFDKRLQDLEKENKALSNKCNQLGASLKISEARMDAMEQYSRNNNVQINGLPTMTGDENTIILEVLSRRLNIPINGAVDVQAMHRIPSAGTLKPLIIQFSNKQLRRKVIIAATKAKLQKKDFSTQDSDPDGKVFIGDHLTVKNKQLLREACQQKTEGKLDTVLVRDGKILVRKVNGGPITRFS